MCGNSAWSRVTQLTRRVMGSVMVHPKLSQKYLPAGRVVLVNKLTLKNALAGN
jgi:hypothetical protein